MPAKNGFTLIELLIVISIIAVLSAIGLTTYSSVQMSARDARRKDDLRSIKVALELYYQKNGQYPSTLSATVTNYFFLSTNSSWIPALVPSFMAKVPVDPKGYSGYLPNNSTDNTGYGYFYWAYTLTGCPPAGQFFALATNLENQSDIQRNAAQNYKHCDRQSLSSVHGWSANAFIITSQD